MNMTGFHKFDCTRYHVCSTIKVCCSIFIKFFLKRKFSNSSWL